MGDQGQRRLSHENVALHNEMHQNVVESKHSNNSNVEHPRPKKVDFCIRHTLTEGSETPACMLHRLSTGTEWEATLAKAKSQSASNSETDHGISSRASSDNFYKRNK